MPHNSIICFSSNDWNDIPSSKLHIMRHLGRSHTVLYVETLGIRTPRLSTRDARRAFVKLKRTLAGLRHVESNVYVWSPAAIPFHGLPGSAWLNATLVAGAVRHFSARLGMEEPIVWSYLPNSAPIIGRLRSKRVVYHCIDDYSAFTDAPVAALQRLESRMCALADLTVVSSRRLYELRRKDSRRIAYIPHGVNLEEFERELAQPRPLPDIDALPRPIAGFVGRIADWIDLELVARCARELPGCSFAMIGPSNVSLTPYAGIPNLHFLGKRDHKDIPHYIDRFDVALMPFAANALVESVNPLKMYEYLAVGKPVVTVPMPEIGEFQAVVTVADPRHFPAAVGRCLENGSAGREARRRAVAGRSWGKIAEGILELLEKGSEAPAAASVIARAPSAEPAMSGAGTIR